jgi:hypothetical protein
MKNLKLFFILAILSYPVYNAVSAVPAEQYHPRGDLDSNGMINAEDLNILNKIISGELKGGECDAKNACGCFCDVNGDGVCNEKDVEHLKKQMNTGYKFGYSAQIDYNKDYLIDHNDLLEFNRDWGRKNCLIGNICDCKCDLNFDGMCDESDFKIFSQYYKYPDKDEYDPNYDLDSNGIINEDDIKIFNDAYLKGNIKKTCQNATCDLNNDGKCDLLDRLEINSRKGSKAKKGYHPLYDFNKDYEINEKDLAIFNREWGKKSCSAGECGCQCDLNGDGICDMADFDIFKKYHNPITNLEYHPKFDLNSSGSINHLDFEILINIIQGNFSKQSCEAYNACGCGCDLNGDGVCDLYDVIEFKKRENTKAKTDKYWARIDYNKDYIINSADVAVFDLDWRRTDCEPGNFCDCACDLNDDGVCDLADIEIFSRYYNVNEDEDAVSDDDLVEEEKIEENKDEYTLAARDFLNGQFNGILEKIDEKRDGTKELAAKSRYLKTLIGNPEPISKQAEEALLVFIVYGADANTKKLGAGERAAVAHSYKSAFGKLPESETDFADMIKIANGRWPGAASTAAEQKAGEHFRRIYKREPAANYPKDNAAITVMAYGLRQKAENRNLNSEKIGINTFKNIYHRHPASTEDWNIMQAITYSGAVR